MNIALAVRQRANCLRSRVGAVLVLENRIVATGYNGTPEGFRNCDEGGCSRCKDKQKYARGEAYDVCVCVHAEQNCLLWSARHGTSVRGAELYSTVRPCFGCLKELLQVRITGVKYLHHWEPPDPALNKSYEELMALIPDGVEQVRVSDPSQPRLGIVTKQFPPDTGHSSLLTNSKNEDD